MKYKPIILKIKAQLFILTIIHMNYSQTFSSGINLRIKGDASIKKIFNSKSLSSKTSITTTKSNTKQPKITESTSSLSIFTTLGVQINSQVTISESISNIYTRTLTFKPL